MLLRERRRRRRRRRSDHDLHHLACRESWGISTGHNGDSTDGPSVDCEHRLMAIPR